MKKIILALSILAISGTAFAGTWDISAIGDCSAYKSDSGPVDSRTCWTINQTVTHNGTVAVGSSTTIAINRTSTQWVHDPYGGGVISQTCSGSGCDYAVTTWACITGGSCPPSFAQAQSDIVTVTAGNTPGDTTVNYSTQTNGLQCNNVAGWTCIIAVEDNISPITITPAASVQLNITGFIDKLLNLFD